MMTFCDSPFFTSPACLGGTRGFWVGCWTPFVFSVPVNLVTETTSLVFSRGSGGKTAASIMAMSYTPGATFDKREKRFIKMLTHIYVPKAKLQNKK
jgi:hypothetical protein